MNYIVLDLEWNQSESEKEPLIPFEIVEIGAVKLNSDRTEAGSFQQIVKPQVYHTMHKITGELIQMEMEELEKGRPFTEVFQQFIEWCGEDYMFVTWGPLDLMELQRNIRYYQLPPLSDGPICFLDAQKLFSIAYEDSKKRRSLEYAVDFLQIDKDVSFHRAYGDAYYTAKVLQTIQDESVFRNYSYDTFHLPKNHKSEIHAQFDTYVKYISREFKDKAEAFEDKEVISSKCYLCHKNIRKKVKWFSPNGKHYYCIAYCDKHGLLKAKIRVRRSENDKIYIVKTMKFITEAESKEIQKKKKS